jgi:hypothetical protein
VGGRRLSVVTVLDRWIALHHRMTVTVMLRMNRYVVISRRSVWSRVGLRLMFEVGMIRVRGFTTTIISRTI